MKTRRLVMSVIVTLIICSISFPAFAKIPQYHAPIVLETAPIDYPIIACEKDMKGTSILAVSIAADGTITDVTLKGSSGYVILDDAAVASVNKWKFSPAHDQNGKVIDSIVILPFDFILTAPRQTDNEQSFDAQRNDVQDDTAQT